MQLFQKQVRKQIKETRDLLDRIQRFQKTVPKGSLIITHKQKKIYYKKVSFKKGDETDSVVGAKRLL